MLILFWLARSGTPAVGSGTPPVIKAVRRETPTIKAVR